MKNFKAGDWILLGNRRPWKATKEDEEKFSHDDDFKLWQPKEGEWVTIVNELHKDCFQVSKWDKELKEALTPDWNILDLKFEPFIGKLPSFLKDK